MKPLALIAFIGAIMALSTLSANHEERSQISVTIDGQTYQCLAGGGGQMGGMTTFCYCTDSNSNQLYLVGLDAEGKTVLEKLLFDYDAPEKCQTGLETTNACRKNFSNSLLPVCRCTDSSSNQLYLDLYDDKGLLVVSRILYDYDAPEKCQANLVNNPTCR